MPITVLASTATTPGSGSTFTVQGAGLAAQFQLKYNKSLLDRAIQLTVLDQFAQKEPFPEEAGAKVMRFLRQTTAPTSFTANAATAGEVQTLTEGTLISNSSTVGFDSIDSPLVQYGQVLEFSDVVGMTALFSALNMCKSRIAETAALHADDIVRNVICGSGIAGVTPAGAFIRMYAQDAANFSALSSAALGSSTLTIRDMLRAFTRLKINRAPKKNGRYYMICPQQVVFNLMLDSNWLNVGYYQDKSQFVRGEVGQYFGIHVVETTNPFIEMSTGTEGVYKNDGAVSIYDSLAVGEGAYGTPIMAKNSPYSPRIQIVKGADKYDVLDQLTAVGWKAYWAAVTLNTTWGINIKAKTTFV